MPTAEIIAIGTELLLGEIQDTNTRYLARTLRDLGVNIYRATMIGDNTERIAQVIREAMQRAHIIITTGGLGPTVDDPTRAAVALAMDVNTEFRPELWEQIQNRFQRFGRIPSENNRKQAWIPAGAIPVENSVGTAPSFICETVNSCIISLPGVPREMEYLMQNAVLPYLRDRFQLTGTIKARVLHVAGVGESIIDDWIADLEAYENPTVGLSAHPGQVDIRITAKADSYAEADRMIAEIETRVRERVSEGIYGVDGDTLEGTVIQALQARNMQAALVEYGTNQALLRRIETIRYPGVSIFSSTEACSAPELLKRVEEVRDEKQAQIGMGISLHTGTEKHILHIYITDPSGHEEINRSYGGECELSTPWAVNTGLEILRRKLLTY